MNARTLGIFLVNCIGIHAWSTPTPTNPLVGNWQFTKIECEKGKLSKRGQSQNKMIQSHQFEYQMNISETQAIDTEKIYSLPRSANNYCEKTYTQQIVVKENTILITRNEIDENGHGGNPCFARKIAKTSNKPHTFHVTDDELRLTPSAFFENDGSILEKSPRCISGTQINIYKKITAAKTEEK